MKKRTLLTTVFFAIFFAFNANAAHLRDHLLISAKLNGAQEVPAVTTNATGVGSFMINATRDTICVDISVTGLSGAIGGIHIHEGDAGVNGPVVIDLTPFVNGNRISATLTGANVAANLSKFLSGKFYLNVHTTANPNGEIRGQLYLETDYSFAVDLSGAKEVPAVATSAYGVGVFNLAKDFSKIQFNVVVQGLSGMIGGAHLHYGAAGVNGAVAVDLTADVMGNVINGTITAPSMQVIDSMMAGSIYINVHTAANPNGEIRSQLMYDADYIYFDASLDGSQEVPSVATNARGAATISLSTTFDTLYYDISTDGLSGAIAGAHFHNGNIGANGGVEIDLTSSINGQRITGMVTGMDLTTTLINKFLRGEIYLNLHTTANPNGEIRGQVYRLTREGYSISMDGGQEVPAVMTNATGTGIVSVDRDQTNAHYMFTVSGLTPSGAHFHTGDAGMNGGVVFDLTPFVNNNAAFGYWSSLSSMPFMLANSVQFRNDSIYINIHTTANPNGEIRGQVLRGYNCAGLTTGLNNTIPGIESASLYPNPASAVLNLNISSTENAEMSISIVDMVGKQLLTDNIYMKAGNNNYSFDINTLTNGMYFVKIQNGGSQFTQKFIKD